MAGPFDHLLAGLKKPAPPAETPLTKAIDTIMQPGFGEAEEKNISDSAKQDLTTPAELSNTDADVGKTMESAKSMTTPVLSPSAMLLLAPSNEEKTALPDAIDPDTGFTVDTAPASVANDLHELASLNTESMEPATKRDTNLNVKAKQLGQRLVLKDSGSVRELCDRIDQMIESNPNLVGPNLGITRNYVQQLMMTLKAHPEFDEVVIAKDVRNVMQFIRQTRTETLAQREVKVEKKVIREIKKGATNKKLGGMEAAFDKIMGGGLNFGGK